MPKKTVLDESAEIYQPRKQLTEREKLKELPPKKRLAYLWEYYRIHALVIIGIVAIIIYAIYNIVTPNIETKFYAAIINNTMSEEVIQKVTDDFSQQLQLNPETETINLNANFYFNAAADYAMNMKQALTTFVAASEVDVIIAPESEFETYAYLGFFDKLSDQLPTDLYSLLTDHFYITQQQEDSEKGVYGIYLSDTDLFKENADNTDDPYIIGIVGNSKHKQNSIEFIRYLFHLYP